MRGVLIVVSKRLGLILGGSTMMKNKSAAINARVMMVLLTIFSLGLSLVDLGAMSTQSGQSGKISDKKDARRQRRALGKTNRLKTNYGGVFNGTSATTYGSSIRLKFTDKNASAAAAGKYISAWPVEDVAGSGHWVVSASDQANTNKDWLIVSGLLKPAGTKIVSGDAIILKDQASGRYLAASPDFMTAEGMRIHARTLPYVWRIVFTAGDKAYLVMNEEYSSRSLLNKHLLYTSTPYSLSGVSGQVLAMNNYNPTTLNGLWTIEAGVTAPVTTIDTADKSAADKAIADAANADKVAADADAKDAADEATQAASEKILADKLAADTAAKAAADSTNQAAIAAAAKAAADKAIADANAKEAADQAAQAAADKIAADATVKAIGVTATATSSFVSTPPQVTFASAVTASPAFAASLTASDTEINTPDDFNLELSFVVGSQISVGSRNGELEQWMLDVNGKLYRYDDYTMLPNSWVSMDARTIDGSNLSGSLALLSVSSDGVLCVLDKNGQAYMYDWDKKVFVRMINGTGNEGLVLNELSVGNKDTIFAVDLTNRDLLQYTPKGWTVLEEDAVVSVGAGLDGTVVVVNEENDAYLYLGNSQWKLIPGDVDIVRVAVGDKNNMWALGPDGETYQLGSDGSWVEVLGADGTQLVGITSLAVNAVGSVAATDAFGNSYTKGGDAVAVVPITTTTAAGTTVTTTTTPTTTPATVAKPKTNKKSRRAARKDGTLATAPKTKKHTKKATKKTAVTKTGRKHTKKTNKKSAVKADTSTDKVKKAKKSRQEKKDAKKAARKAAKANVVATADTGTTTDATTTDKSGKKAARKEARKAGTTSADTTPDVATDTATTNKSADKAAKKAARKEARRAGDTTTTTTDVAA